MRIKVELHRDVVAWLFERRRQDRLIDSFYRQLEKVSTEPITNSEAVADPGLSRYMLRFFTFGGSNEYIAVFQYNVGKDRMRVLKCRRLKPARRPSSGPSEPGEPP